MRRILHLIAAAVALAGFGAGAAAQTPDEIKAEKEFYESITAQVDRLTDMLDLNDAQIFYVDSILVHDYKAMQAEVKELQSKKVSNTDLYYDIQYKWADKIYYAFEELLDEDQWAKYLKSGAEREKKSRDKRRAKANK